MVVKLLRYGSRFEQILFLEPMYYEKIAYNFYRSMNSFSVDEFEIDPLKIPLLGRRLLVSSHQSLEVTAGKGDTFASPDKRCFQSRRLSRSVEPRTCWHRFAGMTASIAHTAVPNREWPA